MTFLSNIESASKKNNSLVCVGLDSDVNKIPSYLQKEKYPLYAFNQAIINATADLVCSYKPQVAYYAAQRAEDELEMTINYIHQNFPDIPVILDSKRGDIGATATMYAIEAFDRYKADAVTVNPYLGTDSLTPYLERQDKGVIILCRTSNPGANVFQNLKLDGEALYEHVAKKAIEEGNTNKNVLLVVGATNPNELEEIRHLVGDMTFLVPGIGAQGGSVKEAVSRGKNKDGAGMIINSSRGIIYAGGGENFDQAARRATIELRDEINQYR